MVLSQYVLVGPRKVPLGLGCTESAFCSLNFFMVSQISLSLVDSDNRISFSLFL